jgi:hypothetical protein
MSKKELPSHEVIAGQTYSNGASWRVLLFLEPVPGYPPGDRIFIEMQEADKEPRSYMMTANEACDIGVAGIRAFQRARELGIDLG